MSSESDPVAAPPGHDAGGSESAVAELRAVAHPTRVRILALLREHPSLTATECARMLDVTPKVCSYHLQTLAASGLISEIPVNGRNRPWRLTDEPQGTESAPRTKRDAVHQRREQDLLARAADGAAATAGTPWASAATVHTHVASMTPAEVAAWCDDVERLTRRHVRRAQDDALNAATRTPVDLLFLGYPR